MATSNLSSEDEYDIYSLATLDNKSVAELAEAYEVSEYEINQIVLKFSTQRAQ